MEYSITVSHQAEQAIDEAAQWYDEQSPGLGTKYLIAIDDAFLSILSHPLLYGFRKKNVRGYSVPVFPYKILYLIEGHEIHIISVLHSSRKNR